MKKDISEDIIEFFSRYPRIKYHKGEKILHPNEYSDQIYLIKKGSVKIYKILNTGQEILINYYDPRRQSFTLFGYTNRLKDYYVEAITDLEVYKCSREDFKHFTDQQPQVKDYIIVYLLISFEELYTQIEWLSIPDAYTRIKAVLYSLGERVGEQEEGKVVLKNKSQSEIKLSHQLIASLTGLSRESVTIQINRLIAEGVLARKGTSLVLENLSNPLADVA